MSTIDHLLTLAKAYGSELALPETTVSWRLFGDSKKLSALVSGGDIQVRRAERALTWLAENWPSDADWPDGVPPLHSPSPEPDTTLPEPALEGAGAKSGAVQ